MSADDVMPESQRASFFLGPVICRGLIPAWVLTGAVVKLIDKSPRLLPQEIWQGAAKQGIDLYTLLAAIIALEITAAGLMFLAPRVSKMVAVSLLSVFCLVLVNEMRAGHSTCGCLGSISPAPWIMLVIDGGLLTLALLSSVRVAGTKLQPLGIGAVSALIGILLVVFMILPERNRSAPKAVAQDPESRSTQGEAANTQDGETEDPVVGEEQGSLDQGEGETNGDAEFEEPPMPTDDDPYGAGLQFNPQSPPAVYVPMVEDWIGKRFDEIDLAQYLPSWPKDIGRGRRYVVFYSRSCPHCQELFELFFLPPPVPSLAVAVPETKDGWETERHLPMMLDAVDQLDLAVGTDWLITFPVTLALEDGVIQCAEAEKSALESMCLMWH